MSGSGVLDRLIASVDACPYGTGAGTRHARHVPPGGLYTDEERARRDASPWTVVQGVLAPLQFAVFLVSLGLVLRYLLAGEGQAVAEASVVAKTLTLYTIMVTGCVWEREVFGRYLFARPFFWEDAFSMLVLALHTAYLAALGMGWGDAHAQMWLALAAYAAYLVNAAQFVMKLRAARLDERARKASSPPSGAMRA
jgi:3-vinyl bacteriochlorophyllide hydratase